MPTWRELSSQTSGSSPYMSEGLCHAILNYEGLVAFKQGEFQNNLVRLKTYNDLLIERETELFNLETQLSIIEDELDVAKANGDATLEIKDKLNNKQHQVDSKKSEIEAFENAIDNINTKISNLKSLLSIENNFTPDQTQERNQYIIERKWSDDSYAEAQELFDDAKLKFEDVRKPKVTIDIDIVNFLELIEEQRNWDKLYLGDSVNIHHEILGFNIRALISDISYSNGEISLSISDIEEIKKKDRLLDMIKKSYSTSTQVEMDKYKWNKTVTDLGEVSDIINTTWDAAKRRIVAGADESVEISNRGIIIRNPKYPNDIIVLQAGIMAISGDNGETWKTVTNKDGVVAERLFGKIVAGTNLWIENESGKFTFDANGATIDGASLVITDTDGTNKQDKWDSAEQNAKEYADSIMESSDQEIADINQAITDLNSYVDGSFKDGVISESEAQAIEKYLNTVDTEKSDFDRRYAIVYNNTDLTGTPKTSLATAKTNYDTSHTNLKASINTAISDGASTSAEKLDVDTKFATYRTNLGILAEKLDVAIETIAQVKASRGESNAKEYADGLVEVVNQDISDVDGRVTSLNQYVDGSFSDGIIEESEAKAIETYINQLSTEKDDIDKRYSEIYANTFLDGTEKTDLNTKKTSFDTAHTNLITSINTAITDGKTTVTEKNDVNTKFASYKTSLSALSTSFEKAINKISTNKANTAQSNSKEYTDGLIATVNTDIGEVNQSVTDLNTYVNGTFEDGIIEQSEAKSIEKYINSLNAEKGDIDSKYNEVYSNANLSGTEKTDLASKKTSYNTAHTNLISSINTAITDGKTTASEKADVDSKFSLYRTALNNLSVSFEKAINKIAQSKVDSSDDQLRTDLRLTAPLPTSLTLNSDGLTATTSDPNKFARLDYRGLYIKGGAIVIDQGLPDDQIASSDTWNAAEGNAKEYADGLKTTIDSSVSAVGQRVTDLNTYVDGTFEDGVIQQAEAKSIEKYINSLNAEKDNFDNKYTAIYSNTDLSGTPKTNLSTKKTAYNTAHTNLISSINTAITDGKTTSAEKTDVDTKFNSYKTALSDLSTAFENAINEIAKKKADTAQSNSENYADGIDTGIRNDLKLAAPLPTSLTLDASGIKASTSDPTKYAILDYRGLFVNNGAIQVKRPDGFSTIIDGYANMNFSVFPHDPPFKGTNVIIDDVYYRTSVTSPANMNFYTYRHEGRYLKMQVAYYVSNNANNYAGNFYVMESEFETYLITKTFTNQGSASANHGEILTMDLGVPTGTQKAFYVQLRAATSAISAYARIIRIWQEG